ncbi:MULTISPECIES: hypothetical protein [unclassified Bradyrhizobium]|uniref:hypothetical protein n=1 Tax=unclassified Bradyrhizobium TaxID=2631580 RepID=UPI002FEFAE5F
MKKTILACACALLLSTGSVLAQAQPAPGASSEQKVGQSQGATKSTTKHTNMKKGTTTGAATGKTKSSSSPSSMGNVGPGTNNNAGPQPGGR